MSRIRKSSAWSEQRIQTFLDETVIPVRLACLDTQTEPLVASLWFFHVGGKICCATQKTASVVGFLEKNPRCGFEVAPESMPYKGVRGQGTVRLSAEEGPAMIKTLIDRYVGTRDTGFAKWLLKRADEEVAIIITPDWLTSWDFSERMSS